MDPYRNQGERESVRDRQWLCTLRKTSLLLAHCPFDSPNATRSVKSIVNIQDNKTNISIVGIQYENHLQRVKTKLIFLKKTFTNLGNFDMKHSFGFSNLNKPIVFKTGAEIKNSQVLERHFT